MTFSLNNLDKYKDVSHHVPQIATDCRWYNCVNCTVTHCIIFDTRTYRTKRQIVFKLLAYRIAAATAQHWGSGLTNQLVILQHAPALATTSVDCDRQPSERQLENRECVGTVLPRMTGWCGHADREIARSTTVADNAPDNREQLTNT